MEILTMKRSSKWMRVVPVAFLLVLCISVGPEVFAQWEEDEFERPELSEGQKQLAELLQEIRTVYMDVYPLYSKLKLLRKSNVPESERREVSERIRNRVDGVAGSLSEQFQSLKQETDDERLRKRIRETEKEVFEHFVTFLRRIGRNWSPENPSRVRNMSANEKIQNNVAGPDLLRRYFLVRLEKKLHNLTGGENDVEQKIDRIREGVQSLYWNMLTRYSELVRKVEESRRTSREGENNSEGKEAEDRSSEQGEQEKEKKDEEHRRAIREAERDWRRFVNERRPEIDEKEKQVRRMWSLYEGRDYLLSREKALKKNLRALMRKMGRIRNMLTREELFSKETADTVLFRHAEFILAAHSDFLLDQAWPSGAFQRLSTRSVLMNLNEKRYRNRVRSMKRREEDYRGFYQDLEKQCRVLSENLGPIAEYLRDLEDDEKQEAGELLSRLHEIARQAHDRLRKDLRATNAYYETFMEMTFDDTKTFRKRFSERMEKLQKEIYGSNEKKPEPTESRLKHRLKKLREQVRQKGFSD